MTTPSSKEMTAKERVLAVYPKARPGYSSWEEKPNNIFITAPVAGPIVGGRLSHYFATEAEAWADAASRLPVAAAPDKEKPMTGVELIAAERERQISVEGWKPEHDETHNGNQLAMAAACYASPVPLRAEIDVPCTCRTADCPHTAFGIHKWVDAWPWGAKWDKRKKHDRLRQLAIAGALIAAEIDRLKREANRDR